MKLRIRGDSIRLRLSQTEVRQISNRESASEATHFPGGKTLHYVLQPASVHQLTADFRDDCVTVQIPIDQAARWADSDEVALKSEVRFASSNSTLLVLLEKDFQCLKSRENEREDETDLYQNPNVGKHCGG